MSHSAHCARQICKRDSSVGERRRDGPTARRPGGESFGGQAETAWGESLCGQAEERKGRLSFFHRIDQARAFAGFADPLPNPGQGVEFVSADASSRLR